MLVGTNNIDLMGCNLCGFIKTDVDSCCSLGFNKHFLKIQHFARCWDTKMNRFSSVLKEPCSGLDRNEIRNCLWCYNCCDRHVQVRAEGEEPF